MTEAREEVLRRIRHALRDVPREEPRGLGEGERKYQREGLSSREAVVSLFVQRVTEYRAGARRVDIGELRSVVEERCRAHRVQRLVVPRDLPLQWQPREVEVIVDDALPVAALDGADGVMTGCAVAIAQTGTIVLDGGASQGRRAISLVPDFHLCVVQSAQIVELVPQAMEQLYAAVRAARPITFISGPSATSDIELHRVEGVHGPRRLEVVVVESHD